MQQIRSCVGAGSCCLDLSSSDLFICNVSSLMLSHLRCSYEEYQEDSDNEDLASEMRKTWVSITCSHEYRKVALYSSE